MTQQKTWWVFDKAQNHADNMGVRLAVWLGYQALLEVSEEIIYNKLEDMLARPKKYAPTTAMLDVLRELLQGDEKASKTLKKFLWVATELGKVEKKKDLKSIPYLTYGRGLAMLQRLNIEARAYEAYEIIEADFAPDFAVLEPPRVGDRIYNSQAGFLVLAITSELDVAENPIGLIPVECRYKLMALPPGL